jgi:hypothetical protein
VKNKFETAHVYGEMSVINKAMNLAYSELCKGVEDINTELEAYQKVTSKDIKNWVNTFIVESNLCQLMVKKSQNG